MFQQKYNPLLKQLDDSVNEICLDVTDSLQRLKETLACIQALISDLDKFVFANPFQDQSEEIYFFKKVKPQFVARTIFESERYNLETQQPKGLSETLIGYFKDELRYIDRFFKLNAFQYQYFKNEVETLDHLYFINSANSFDTQSSGKPILDIGQGENMGYLFAKFIAYERMQDCLLFRIKSLVSPQISMSEEVITHATLQWTGDSINLVEVAYGIWLTGQVNNGNASISEIIRYMEKVFDVKIGRAHRRWSEISQRKRSSYTKYLDRMREAIFQRVDGELA